MKPQYTGLRRIVRATLFSLSGLRATWQNEAAFREECVLALVLTPTALWLGRTAAERALLIAVVWLVLIVELLNTAIESAVDRISTDRHELAGQAKDQGSASVFVSLMLALVVWGLIVWDRFGS